MAAALTKRILGALGIWLLILVLAILNGALREVVLLPALGKPWALLLSGAMLAACIVVVSMLLVPRLGHLSIAQALLLGLAWLCLTLVFEFGFGLSQRKNWEELFAAYTFQDGNIWTLVLVVVTLSPALSQGRGRKARFSTGGEGNFPSRKPAGRGADRASPGSANCEPP